MRKVSAVLCSLFVAAATLAVLALPAAAGIDGGGSYPPSSTIPTVPPSQAAQQSRALAFTGSDSKPLVILGIIALVLGAVLVVAARRRSSVQAHRAS